MSYLTLVQTGAAAIKEGSCLQKQKKKREAQSKFIDGASSLLAGASKLRSDRHIKEPEKSQLYADIRNLAQNAIERAEALKGAASSTSPTLDAQSEGLRSKLEDAILKDAPGVTFDDVIGLDLAKKALEESVLIPKKFPQLFQGKRRPCRGVLLYGPPGTGKTYLAKALAGVANSTFFSVSASDVFGKMQGDSERTVRQIFALAKAKQPSIIFFDEIDGLLGLRKEGEHEGVRRAKTEFLVQFQALLDSHDDVLLLAATNEPWTLDPAAIRRFQQRIYIPLPEADDRQQILTKHLGPEVPLSAGVLGKVSRQTKGFSGADLAIVCREALMEPVREALASRSWIEQPDDGGTGTVWLPCPKSVPGARRVKMFDLPAPKVRVRNVESTDLLTAASKIKPSVSQSQIAQHEFFTSKFGIDGSLKIPEKINISHSPTKSSSSVRRRSRKRKPNSPMLA